MAEILNPSPKFPNGKQREKVVYVGVVDVKSGDIDCEKKIGEIHGKLSPNPKLTLTLVEGEHATPVRVVTAPKELKVTY